MSATPKVLVLGASNDEFELAAQRLQDTWDLVSMPSMREGLDQLVHDSFHGVCIIGKDASFSGFLVEAGGVLQQIPNGVALLDEELNVLWANEPLQRLAGREIQLAGEQLYDCFDSVEMLGPDFSPFHTALATGETARSKMRAAEKTYFDLQATPLILGDDEFPCGLLVMVRDITIETQQEQKLDAIYHAGLELGDLSPDEIFEMSIEDRIELLKSRILHYTQDLLGFETVEIRLVEQPSGKLTLLLADGMNEVAERRELYARAEGNGVTGFVASSGKSYLCEDTTTDPLYLPGAPGARSSLTVPLMWHDETIGTFNVESPKPNEFTQNDLKFLALFCRELAIALNTLELLEAEKATTLASSTALILSEIADPLDEILNDATWVMDKSLGSDEQVTERLQEILNRTRTVRQLIQHIRQETQPKSTLTSYGGRNGHELLQKKRVLVADSDREIRQAAHDLLGEYGCIVETAHDGDEACLMIRSCNYDAALLDIRLPDMNGFECFEKIRNCDEHIPIVFLTEFGYDPTHSIVKARPLGLQAVLFKPFRRDQLLTEVEKAVAGTV